MECKSTLAIPSYPNCGSTFAGYDTDISWIFDWIYSWSDRRLKSNVVKFTDTDQFLRDVQAIELCEFDKKSPFKEGTEHVQAGVIAQQVKGICPAAVVTNTGCYKVARNDSRSVVHESESTTIVFENKHYLPFSDMQLSLECAETDCQRVQVEAVVDDWTVRISVPDTCFDRCTLCGVASDLHAIDPNGMIMILLGAIKSLATKVELLERSINK